MNHNNEKDYDMLAFILSGSVRIRIYVYLVEKPGSYAYEISRNEHIDVSSVFRSLRALKSRDVVKCLNPKSKRRKLYQLTPKALKLKDDVLRRL